MLKRYTKEVMGKIWSDANMFFLWLVVELAVLRVRWQIGEMPHEVPDNLEDEIRIDPEEINRIEDQITKHNVVAFLEYMSPQFPKVLQSWLHRGLTSNDIIDTALSLQLIQSTDELLKALLSLMRAIKNVAFVHKYTVEIGRTHGIHAEPITFGVKMANWYAELERNHLRLIRLKEIVSVGKISGAVGMFTLDPQIEELTCESLGLQPIIATQIISRDILSEYMATLGIVAASIGKIALNFRLLSQTEIGEIMEPFSKDQKGSSAMPHKKNPIGDENISGLMRTVYTNVQTEYEIQANCWHERSIDNSAPERVVVVDSSIALHYAMVRLAGIIEKMRVFPDRMLENLQHTKGLIFSQEVMMLVAEKSNLPREKAHTLVRDIALKCWEDRSIFLEALLASNSVMQYVSKEEILNCFRLDEKVKHVDYIFDRVFGKNHMAV